MIKVELTVEDPKYIAGVEYARDEFNKTLPEEATPLTSEEYILMVARSAVKSYADQAERAEKLRQVGLI